MGFRADAQPLRHRLAERKFAAPEPAASILTESGSRYRGSHDDSGRIAFYRWAAEAIPAKTGTAVMWQCKT